MPLELIEKILDECAGKNTIIMPHQMGDLLADPRAMDILKMCKDRKLMIIMSTPGIFLDKEKSKAMISMGVDLINISLDSLDKKIYEKTRSLPFDKVMQNINDLFMIKGPPAKAWISKIDTYLNLFAMKGMLGKSLASAADRCLNLLPWKRPSTRIWISAVDMFFNKNSRRAFIKYWAKLVDHVQISRYVQYPKIMHPELPQKKAKNSRRCQRLKTDMIILSSGEVAKCCIDFEGSTIFGNVASETIAQIWNGRKRSDFIRAMRIQKRKNLYPCNTCTI